MTALSLTLVERAALLRIAYQGAGYHVRNRGRGRQASFRGKAGYETFTRGIATSLRRRVRPANEVLAAVAATWDMDGSTFTSRGRQLGPRERQARQVALLFCRDKTDLTLATLRERFGGVPYSAVGQNVQRVPAAMQEDRQWDRRYRTIMSRLAP